jgi:hypothetical protein
MKSNRSDSASAAVKAAQNASLGHISPPAHIHLRDSDICFWNAIVSARARDTWTDVDLSKAANLARCQSDIERISIEIDNEGDTLTNERGTVVMNPKHSLLETLSRREMAISRAIHVHAEATVGKSEDAASKLANEKKAKVAAESTDDDLIPRMYSVK